MDLLPQSFVSLKCQSIIKNVDKFIFTVLTEGMNQINDIENIKVEDSQLKQKFSKDFQPQLNEKSLFYKIFESIFASKPSKKLLESKVYIILNCSEQILRKIEKISETKDVPFDVTELVNFFGDYAEEIRIPADNRNETLFWCFLYPFLNLTPIATRKRSKVPAKFNGIMMLCFLLIKWICIPESNDNDNDSNENIFCNITPETETIFKNLKKMFYSIVKKLAQEHERDLGDTVLHFCSVADENKPVLLLTELFLKYFDSIWKHLMSDQDRFESILMHFVPFIRYSFTEPFPE